MPRLCRQSCTAHGYSSPIGRSDFTGVPTAKSRFFCCGRVRPELAHLYGPAARCKPKVMIWRSWSCASVSGLLTEPLNSWPSWISARVRSHSQLGPEGQMGHLITNALARPFSISFSNSQTLAGKPTITFGDQPKPSAIRLVNLSAFIRLLPS